MDKKASLENTITKKNSQYTTQLAACEKKLHLRLRKHQDMREICGTCAVKSDLLDPKLDGLSQKSVFLIFFSKTAMKYNTGITC